MSIKYWSGKIKGGWENTVNHLPQGENAARCYTAAIIILVGLSSFGLGRLSAIDEARLPIMIENGTENSEIAPPPAEGGGASTQSASVASAVNPPNSTQLATGGKLMGSRNGTKYYFPWCGSNIAEKNKIWFNSEEEAKAKGYSPAANCKGLK